MTSQETSWPLVGLRIVGVPFSLRAGVTFARAPVVLEGPEEGVLSVRRWSDTHAEGLLLSKAQWRSLLLQRQALLLPEPLLLPWPHAAVWLVGPTLLTVSMSREDRLQCVAKVLTIDDVYLWVVHEVKAEPFRRKMHEDTYRLALSAMRDGDMARAVALAEDALRLQPKKTPIYLALVVLALERAGLQQRANGYRSLSRAWGEEFARLADCEQSVLTGLAMVR